MRWPAASKIALQTAIGSDIAQLADPLHSRRINLIVLLREHKHFDAGHVGIHRQEIIGEIVVDVARLALVEFGRFMQCRGHAPDQAAHQLTACGPRVHDAPSGKGA
jgi:hypothetical protein